MQYWNDLLVWFGGLGTVAIIILVALIIGMILLNLLFLKIGIKAVKGSFKKSIFGTWILMILCNMVPCVGCILQWVVINTRHKTGFGNAIIAWLIVIFLPGLIVGGILVVLVLTGVLISPF